MAKDAISLYLDGETSCPIPSDVDGIDSVEPDDICMLVTTEVRAAPRLYGHISVALHVTEEDVGVLTNGGDAAAELMLKLIKDGRFNLDGESWFPAKDNLWFDPDDNDVPVPYVLLDKDVSIYP